MMIRGPPVVARLGRTALRISLSGLRPASSVCQKAASVAITATQVTPRSRRNDAARTSIEIRLDSSIESAVRPTIKLDIIGEWSKQP